MAIRRSAEDKRWDDRRWWDRIYAEARFKQIDLSKYVTMKEAAGIMNCSLDIVRRRYLWLEGIELCGRKFVKRKRVEWLQKFRDGQLPWDDRMGESLAPFDVHAQKAEIQRQKDQEEERKRQEAEAQKLHGFHVYDKCWIDYDANDTWVPTDNALLVIQRTRDSLVKLADRGRIRRRWADYDTYQPVDAKRITRKRGYTTYIPEGETNPRRARPMWSLQDLDRFVERRDNQGRARGKSFDDPDRPFTLVRVYEMERSAHERKLITRKEAADILCIHPNRVCDLVTAGKLKAYSRIPHRKGCRIWLSEDEVLAYANKPERLERRERWQMYRMKKDLEGDHWQKARKKEPYDHWWWKRDELDGSHPVDHREDYTLPQAARVLGCSVSAVRQKVKSGLLPAFKKARKPNDRWKEARWWFIKKDDLWAYKGTLDYKRRRRAYLKRQNPENFPDD